MSRVVPPSGVAVAAASAPPSGHGAGPQPPPREAIERAVRAKTRGLLVERIRISLLLALGSLCLFTAQDLLFFRDRVVPLMVIKGLQLVIIGAILWVIRADRVPRNAVAFALCLAAVLCALATAAGIVRGTIGGSALLFIILTAGTAIGLPWGAWAQAGFVAVCAGLLAWNDYAIHAAPLPILVGPVSAAMLTAGLISVFVARSVERYRFQIEEREMGLRLREELFRSLIENGGDLIVVVAADGRIHYVSPSVRRLLGYAPETWLGRRLFDFMHPEDVSRLREALSASAPEGGAAQIEVRLRDTARTWRVLDGAVANLLGNMAVRGLVFNARDVTQRRQAESDLRRNQAELTHVLRLGTISEIAAALAHEINQPLAAISNYASACARRLDAGAGSSPEVQRGLQLIAAEALRAGRIVRTLRDHSRKGDGGMEVVDVNGIVRRAVELMEPQARLQGISLRVHSCEDPPSVYADAIQIEQVVLNLLLNGIESMQTTPVKILSASTVIHDGRAEVCVRDTGVGLDPAVGNRVFEPFFTTKPTGLGMGLAISRRIIEAHGGAFRVLPNPDGRGSAFSFSLPLVPQRAARAVAAAAASQPS
jgi:two-component system sensor kinase FixL